MRKATPVSNPGSSSFITIQGVTASLLLHIARPILVDHNLPFPLPPALSVSHFLRVVCVCVCVCVCVYGTFPAVNVINLYIVNV